MTIPAKYLFFKYKGLELPLLCTSPFSHAEFSGLHPVTSAGYAARVNPMAVQAYDHSETLGLSPGESDSLRLTAIFSGMSGPVNYVILERLGEPYPVVTLLPLMELARLKIVAGCRPGSDAFGTASFYPHGLGMRLRSHALQLERGGAIEPLPEADTVLNFWLRSVLEITPIPA